MAAGTWKILALAAILTVGAGQPTASNRFTGLKTLSELYSQLKAMTTELWEGVNDPRWLASWAFRRNTIPMGEHILQFFAEFGDALDRTGLDRDLKRLRQRLLFGTMGNMDSWAQADADIGMVDAVYLGFRIFRERYHLRLGSGTSRLAFTDLAETILQEQPESVESSMLKLHELLTKGNESVFQNLPSALTQMDGQGMCFTGQSTQQLIYNMYNIAFLTNMKGFAMTQFSWMVLSLYDSDNFTRIALEMQSNMDKIITEQAEAASQAMALTSNEFWMCDPVQQKENETFIQLTNLIQGHIQNEIDLNPKADCRDDCTHYSGNTYVQVNSCYQGLFCDVQPKCTGRLFDCRFIDSDSHVCLAGSNVTNRKYNWIEYENGRTLGNRQSCPTDVAKVDSWWYWVMWHCSYCFCLCDQPGPKSDRYFSLQPALARGVDRDHLGSNRVVTGLRFVKVNRVVHLQIQDGVLLPGGFVNSTTLEWQPITPFKVTDHGIIKGEDYHAMSWEQRAIDLDDVVGPRGNVLTGVRLRLLGSSLNLEILTTPFDISSGRLGEISMSSWTGNDNTPLSRRNSRTEVKLIAPDIPTSCPTSAVDSHSSQFIKFTHSDIDKDVAQTTVPFIDAQPVVPEPPSLLAGAGLYHKGSPHCGGFVAPKVLTYDYSHYLTDINIS